MDDISLIESDPSSILFSDNSNLLDELIEDIFDSTFFGSTFTRPLSSWLPSMSDSTASATTVVAASYTPHEPKRGGRNHLGIYVGGCPLKIDYKLKKPYSYHSIFQVRTPKAIATTEKTLYNSKLNTTLKLILA